MGSQGRRNDSNAAERARRLEATRDDQNSGRLAGDAGITLSEYAIVAAALVLAIVVALTLVQAESSSTLDSVDVTDSAATVVGGVAS